ncbi:MAG: class I SAM-dependent methyltransferase [Armatimonadota bacterium]|nr:class I SAM-dependent methyltransferase [Armatimonadota bacterium]MDR7421234.1 class I SAM-dependent methyltransferase [Armatimonadota bacterium]MDR7453000.1 class I SAM-dependent methyltransferase [Armatimonadota bacterium]MDR7457557.1 class I SAM-dependent methyltransferase [Armatimonadota bacterium]MDR7496335.1 class I SAM-dependent methyltransferase [Armatimonadota bacterium]
MKGSAPEAPPAPAPERSGSSYAAFWEETGAHFPSLKGAASTAYYFECERTLFADFGARLGGARVLKTDLWDEAKNTEILRWAAEQGARPYGVDISFSIVREARALLWPHRPGCVVGDVRALPFPTGVFDLVYSMGTVEHFPETEVAVREIYRVLRPGGLAIVGVPNRLDPFLRPALVGLMRLADRYPYGMEKSYTAGALRRMLAAAGFEVTRTSGILFMPGWLRMLDLWLHTRRSRLAALSGWLVQPFAWAYRRFPAVRRYGYLIAAAAIKPGGPGGSPA